jgi:hypothetical protein
VQFFFLFERFDQRPVLQPVLMKFKKVPDGDSYDNDSAQNGGEHAGLKGMRSHP